MWWAKPYVISTAKQKRWEANLRSTTTTITGNKYFLYINSLNTFMWTFTRLKLNHRITSCLQNFLPLNYSSSKVGWVQNDLYMTSFYQNSYSDNSQSSKCPPTSYTQRIREMCYEKEGTENQTTNLLSWTTRKCSCVLFITLINRLYILKQF